MVSQKYSPDFEINLNRLKDYPTINIIGIQTEDDFPVITKEDVIIDGLFGSGLTRPLDGVAARLVRHIVNATSKAVIAIDIPSGLFGEDNKGNQQENIIRATYTLTLQFPKISFFFPENEDFIGDWSVLDIGLHKQAIEQEPASANYISEADARARIKDRKKYSHKGVYGHALLIAGSYGMMGAAVLSSKATIRSGAGLLTTHIPRKGVDILHASVPESLTSIDASDTQFSHYPVLEKFTAVGIGPGIGQDPRTKEGLIELLQEVRVPIVIECRWIETAIRYKQMER
jgi:NAD(P)H-hydrate epimerase